LKNLFKKLKFLSKISKILTKLGYYLLPLQKNTPIFRHIKIFIYSLKDRKNYGK